MPERPYSDPFLWFDAWYLEASQTNMPNYNAMTIATCSIDGELSVRVVLLKEWDKDGFVFYTNLMSDKGVALLANPEIGANFYWRELDRQIRIDGKVEQVSDAQADAYFATRARSSQIGAWASQQSAPLESRQELLDYAEEFEQKFDGQEVPRPDHWSGFRIVPRSVEFWQNSDFRLHDRWRFTVATHGWLCDRLAP